MSINEIYSVFFTDFSITVEAFSRKMNKEKASRNDTDYQTICLYHHISFDTLENVLFFQQNVYKAKNRNRNGENEHVYLEEYSEPCHDEGDQRSSL